MENEITNMIENLTEDIVKGPTLFRAFAKVFAIPVAAPHIHASVNATSGENVFLHHLLLLEKIDKGIYNTF